MRLRCRRPASHLHACLLGCGLVPRDRAPVQCSPRTLQPTLLRPPPCPACLPLQEDALARPGVLAGRNLVYSASTSAGKSLVAEVLMLRRVLTTGKPVMLVLPYKALCAEKAAQLEALLEPMKRTVKHAYGGLGERQIFTPETGGPRQAAPAARLAPCCRPSLLSQLGGPLGSTCRRPDQMRAPAAATAPACRRHRVHHREGQPAGEPHDGGGHAGRDQRAGGGRAAHGGRRRQVGGAAGGGVHPGCGLSLLGGLLGRQPSPPRPAGRARLDAQPRAACGPGQVARRRQRPPPAFATARPGATCWSCC